MYRKEDIIQNKIKYIDKNMLEKRCRICGCGGDSLIRYIDNERNWTGEWLCNACYGNVWQRLPDSQNNIIKSLRDSRIGNLSRFCDNGKSVIGQWIAGKTLGLKDLNIENDNFREPIDLSDHLRYKKPDVKTRTYNKLDMHWGIMFKKYDFDTLIAICMDEYELWKNVERVYIIPKDILIFRKSIAFYKYPSRSTWYDDFRIDEKPFNDVYHSVDIPKFFSPFDLWKGKYNKKI